MTLHSPDTIRAQGFTIPVLASAVGIIVLAALTLRLMGRTPICSCGTIKLWHGVVNSSENSQHIADWYTFSHIIHGFLFFGAFAAVRRLSGIAIPLGYGLLAALTLESLWEIAENTEAVINRYRTATVALDYYGDSVLNSVSDILSMTLGFLLASRLPALLIVGVAITMELVVGAIIRDNLALNIIMLIWPMDWIKVWQAGG